MIDEKIEFEKNFNKTLCLNWLMKKESIIFDRSLTESDSFYFTTERLNNIFPKENKKGILKSGLIVYYSLDVIDNGITATLSIVRNDFKDKEKLDSLLQSCNMIDENDTIVLKQWIVLLNKSVDNLNVVLDNFYKSELIPFENELLLWNKNKKYIINKELFIEGAMQKVCSNKYERNREARQKCIEANGAYCHICGFNFGNVYGSDFSNIIEVHHIKPLNEIKESYVVDPINDLIPLCANCHLIVHSKKDGTYTIDEVKKMIAINKK